MQAEVDAALRRWREVTAPLDPARAERDAQLLAVSLHALSSTAKAARARGRRDDMTHHHSSSPPVSSSPPLPPPRAWSHAAFLARVATFGVATWFAKPRCISPLACARFGWVNTARDLLTCAHCGRVLCVALNAKLSARGAEAVAAAFARQLETAHDDACPWSHNASPESFTVLPLLGPSQVTEALWGRVTALLEQAAARDAVQRALAETLVSEDAVAKLLDASSGLDETTLLRVLTKRLQETAKTPAVKDDRVLLNAVWLSACGWVVQDEEKSSLVPVVSCEFCNRHVTAAASSSSRQPATTTTGNVSQPEEETKQDGGRHAGEDRDESDDAPPAKRQRLTASGGDQETTAPRKPLEPIAEHRWFCPWVVAQQRRDSDARDETDDKSPLAAFVALPGWRQNAQALRLLDAAANAAVSTTTPSPSPLDALASVQAVLSLPESSRSYY